MFWGIFDFGFLISGSGRGGAVGPAARGDWACEEGGARETGAFLFVRQVFALPGGVRDYFAARKDWIREGCATDNRGLRARVPAGVRGVVSFWVTP